MAHYKDMKFKMTPQRAAILEFLEGNTSHPSAEDIYEAVKEAFPMMSFATVYNTLQTLKDHNMVWELSIDDERKRYDPNTNLHHHMICLGCREVVDIHASFDLDVSESNTNGYLIIGTHVEFYGYCHKCRKDRPEESD